MVCSNASIIGGWPLGRLIAQLLVVPALNYDLAALEPLIGQGIGGVLLLGSTPAPGDLGTLVASTVAGAPDHLRPFVMADEEGGGIQRLAGLVASFPWPRQIAQTMTAAQTQALGDTVGEQMSRAGINMDLAPVLDVDGRVGPNASNPDGSRSFSADPAIAARYGAAFMKGLDQGGVTSVVKHFPGLGGATGNTDNGPAATLPLAALRLGGLLPFRATIAAGAPAVMVSNATVPGLTSTPASLSPAVIAGLLRGELGFTGLVITDSLSAGAISQAGYSLPQAVVASLHAGADMILFGSTITPAETALLDPTTITTTVSQVEAAVATAVTTRQVHRSTLELAVEKILSTKHADLCSNA